MPRATRREASDKIRSGRAHYQTEMNESRNRRKMGRMKDLCRVLSDSFSARTPGRVCPL